jgi:hypothetical protein
LVDQREQEQRESLSATLRTLGTEATRNTVTLERLQTRNDDLTRQVSLSNSQERSARAALRTAEASARALREEMVRMKTVVGQVRNACANDVRKRDVQIQKLKTHLTSQQRGNKTGLVGASIVITPGASGTAGHASKDEDGPGVEDPEYSLRQETTEFLTQLSQSLSDENDNLISLVRTTLTTLKELQGLPEMAERAELADIEEDDESDGQMLQALPTSYDSLASDMHNVLENLRSLLTNPNFVPIEEISVREEEILRLRHGWERMEVKWREAMLMMEGWRKRMIEGGDTVNIEELKNGLGLGQGLDSPSKLNGGQDVNKDQSIEDIDYEDSFQTDVASDDEVDALPSDEMEEDFMEDKIGVPRPTNLVTEEKPLKEVHGNAKSPRKVTFASKTHSPAVSLGTKDENAKALSSLPTPTFKRPKSSLGKHKAAPPKEGESRIPRKVRFSSSTMAATPEADMPMQLNYPRMYFFVDPLQTLKRLSSPHPEEEEHDDGPKLTTQEKLNIAAAEAEAAAVAAGLEVEGLDVRFEGFDVETKKTKVESGKDDARKTRIGGRARRRKSTLTPAELEALMFE